MASPSLIVACAALALLAACGSRTSGDIRTAGSYGELEVMPLSPEVGQGTPTDVGGVRIREDGSTQAMLIVGHCSVPTELEVTETSTTVTLAAFERRLTDEACPMIGESVFVALELDIGVRGRQVVDARTGDPVRVVRCATRPLPGWCIPSSEYKPDRRRAARHRKHKVDLAAPVAPGAR